MNNISAYSVPQGKSLSDYITILRRHRSMALIVSITALLLTVVTALVWPPVYRSTATILIEQQEIPPDLVRSTVSTYAAQRIQTINQRVMTRTNLTEIIKKYDLYAKKRRSEPMEVVIEEMRDDVKLDMVSADVVDPRNGQPTKATIAFTLSYENENPLLAQKVANELTSLFLNENLSSRREMATQASDFITEEANRISVQLTKLESQLAKFKEHNADSMPDLMQFNMQLTERIDRELSDVEQNLRSLKERHINLEAQLAQVNPNGAAYSDNGERILGPVDRLKALRAKYISLSAIYASDHPDLVRMRKEIASLELEVGKTDSTTKDLENSLTAARGELADDRKRYGDEHPTVLRLERQVAAMEKALAKQQAQTAVNTIVTKDPDNPAYIQLQTQLQTVEAETSSLLQKKADLQAKLQDIDKRVAESPLVESKYRELTRDYENAWAKYKEIKAKQMEAKLGEALETERKGERFTLIDPPVLPEKPASPNRMAIMLLGAVLSLGGGVGTVAVRDSVDGTVRGERGVFESVEMPPLAGIPYIELDEERQRRKLSRIVVAATLLLAIIIAVVWVNYYYMPLDVLWYAAQRRLGLF